MKPRTPSPPGVRICQPPPSPDDNIRPPRQNLPPPKAAQSTRRPIQPTYK